MALHNDGEEVRSVLPQEKIAQLVVIPYLEVTFQETDSLDETGRGAGGFGLYRQIDRRNNRFV